MKIAVICSSNSQNGEAVSAALGDAGHDAVVVEADEAMVSTLRALRPQIAFNAMCEQKGMNGSIQDILSALNIPYVGSSSHACRKAFDSSLLSGVMESYWAVVGSDLTASWPLGICLSRDAFGDWGIGNALDLFEDCIPGGFPLCVKPSRSKGAVRVDCQSELEEALLSSFDASSDALVQQWIDGVSMDVCIIGNGWDAFALPPVELANEAHQDYVPVRLSSLSSNADNAQAIRAEVERAALEAYWAFNLRDYASIRMVWDGGQARVVKVRPIVDMTENSSFAKACNSVGLSVAAVLNELVDMYI